MDLKTNKLLAESHLGVVTSEDYVRWAVACLESGQDSKNIRILASMQKPLYSSEVDFYFSRCLKDLGWTMPERRECLLNYARDLAHQIVSGDLSPRDGCRKIYLIASALQYPKELMAWVYFDDNLDPSTYNALEGAELDQAIKDEATNLARL